MFRAALIATACVLPVAAHARTATQTHALLSAGLLPAVADFNFAAASALDPRISFYRTSVAYDFDCSATPLLKTFAAQTPMIPVCDYATKASLGWRIEGASTIQNARSRDLTNASWTKTSATAALNQTGIDGVANAASRLTATGANATACITGGSASQQRILSVFLRRATGSGEVDVSQDGATWTDVTAGLSSGWTRLPAGGLYATVANAKVCIRIVTSLDAVDVDYAQLEQDQNAGNIAPTTPMLTTNLGNVVRSQGYGWIPTASIPGFTPDSFTIAAKLRMPVWIVPSTSGKSLRRGYFQVDDGTGINALFANGQTDDDTNPNCNLTSGNPYKCPASNWDSRVGFATTGGYKVRGTMTPANQLLTLVPPEAGYSLGVVVTYDSQKGSGIVTDNGFGAVTLSNSQVYPGGPSVELDAGVPASAFSAGFAKRLVFGGTPSENMAVAGSIAAGDVITLTATSPNINGGTGVAVAYTVQSSDTTAAILAASLAAAVTANSTLAAAGVSATSSGANVQPSHPASQFILWSRAVTGTETVTIADNTGACYCDLQRVTVYAGRLTGSAMTAALRRVMQ